MTDIITPEVKEALAWAQGLIDEAEGPECCHAVKYGPVLAKAVRDLTAENESLREKLKISRAGTISECINALEESGLTLTAKELSDVMRSRGSNQEVK